MKERIKTLDGLRFLAALGVLWIHAWTKHGNPRFYIGQLDITNLLAIGGNGVDLFFVISGFCMYYFYAGKAGFSYSDFLRFLKKRWIRLSPAFYTATIVYLAVAYANHAATVNVPASLLNSFFYLNAVLPHSAASHFWTLSVEWQFYLIIPFILLYQYKIGFGKIFAIVFVLLTLAAVISVVILKERSDWLTPLIIFRGLEFGCGVIVGYAILNYSFIVKYRPLWLLLFIITLYAGRVLIAKPVLALSPGYYNLFKLAGFTLMGAGFAGVLYLSLTSKKWLLRLLGNKLFKTMGRVSYSFYLWHMLIVPVVASLLIQTFPMVQGIAAPLVTTVISTVLLYPVAKLSYYLLEQPFLLAGNLKLQKAATI